MKLKPEKYLGRRISFYKEQWGDKVGVTAVIHHTPTVRDKVHGRNKKDAFELAKREIRRVFRTGFYGEKNKQLAR